jgi:myo-inositol-1(or 4)-monophosphatase
VASLTDQLQALESIMHGASKLALQVRETMSVELKPDGSLVTDADRAVEEFLREELSRVWHGTSFWGEELGQDEISGHGHWLIDPIDGTSNFAFGSPLWGISVAMFRAGQLELGAVWLTQLDEHYLAQRAIGSFKNREPMPQIPPGEIKNHELVSYGETVAKRYPVAQLPGKMRSSGAFVVDGTFTAMQRYRGLIGCNEYLYDAAACILINQELGAEVRWGDGADLDFEALANCRRFDRAWVIFPADSGITIPEPR